MKIALAVDEFLPNGTRAHARMVYELALELKKRGNEPIVITPGDPNQGKSLKVEQISGVEVWRFRSGLTRGVGFFRRAINESLLSFRAWIAIRKQVKAHKIDLFVNYSPTIFFGPLAWLLKSQGAFVYLVLRDFFPQWAIDQGLLNEKSPATLYFRIFERINYNTAHRIGLQSKANLDLFLRRYSKYENAEILMNWTRQVGFQLDLVGESIRSKLSIGHKVLFFYGGNIGHAQDMSNILRLARTLQDDSNSHFLILGDGDEFSLINDLKSLWLLDNVTILPSVSQQKFDEILSEADVGLFSLSKAHSAHNFPGKILGYLRAGIPILGSVNPGNDLLDLVNTTQTGFVCVNGEDQSLEAAARHLSTSLELRESMGLNGKLLLKQKFSVEAAASTILTARAQG